MIAEEIVRSDRTKGFFVKFWGTRGSIPTPGSSTRRFGGNTSCVEIRIDGKLFICDGGTGLRDLGQSLMKENRKDAIAAHLFFSHPHWDHIQGFPFFVPAYVPKNRFRIYGIFQGDRRPYELLSGQMQSDYFPVSFSDLGATVEPADIDSEGHLIDGVHVTAFQQVHPGKSWAFSFEKDGLKAVYATDSELDQLIMNKGQAGSNTNALRQLPVPTIDFVRNADLLIADAQYTDEEYPSKLGWGHARCTTTVDLAVQAGVKQLALFHHDPLHTDEDVDRKVETCRIRARMLGSDLVVFGAREGLELKLRP